MYVFRHDFHFFDLNIRYICDIPQDIFHFVYEFRCCKYLLPVFCHPYQMEVEIIHIISFIYSIFNSLLTFHMYHPPCVNYNMGPVVFPVHMCYNCHMKRMSEYNYHIGVKVRIYPSYTQMRIISKNDGAQRFVYNRLVSYNTELYRLKNVTIFSKPVADRISYLESVIRTPKLDSAIKNSAPWLYDAEIDSMSIANGIQNYRKAWKQFRAAPGSAVPTFHKKGYSKQYNTNAHYPKDASSAGDGNVHLGGDWHVTLPILGRIRYKDSGRLRDIFWRKAETRIGTITVSMDACGDYWASFSVASDAPFLAELPKTGAISGYDMNVENLYTDSNGHVEENQKPRKSHQDKITKLQKRLSRRAEVAKREHRSIYESKNYQSTRLQLAKEQRAVARERQERLHILSKREVENQDFLFFEDLREKNLLKNHSLASSISDAAWASFMEKVAYKSELYGKVLLKVPARNTTQTCHCCGYVLRGGEKLTLADREWVCPSCGVMHSRDHNAACVVLQRGKKLLNL